MSEHENGNGSQGRFLRIEAKVDEVKSDLSNFKVDVITRLVRIEEAARFRVDAEAKEVSRGSYRWMKVGIGASFLVGVASLILRLT